MSKIPNGLDFLRGGHVPVCRAHVEKVFGNYFGMQFCKSGSISIGTAEFLNRYVGPVVWITQPTEFCTFFPAEAGGHWDHRYVVFAGSRTDVWKAMGLLEPLPTRLRLSASFCKKFDTLLNQIQRMDRLSQFRNANLLEDLLIDLLQEGSPIDDLDIAEYVLKSGGMKERGLPDYHRIADDLGFSYSTFLRRFRELYGMTPHRFYMERRIEGVPEYLQKNWTLERIAKELGFSDAYHLSKQFKRFFGVTPKEYKRSLLLA